MLLSPFVVLCRALYSALSPFMSVSAKGVRAHCPSTALKGNDKMFA
jgi:hypothetical protein